MRWWLLLLVGCGTSSDGGAVHTCPDPISEGAPCDFVGECWGPNSFSSFYSGFCRCEDGVTVCEPLLPREGDACGDEPITSCSYEGVPSCLVNPTAELCSCVDGIWQCECACYGGLTSCPVSACDLPPARVDGRRCATVGEVCSYTLVDCTCEASTTGGEATFVCR